MYIFQLSSYCSSDSDFNLIIFIFDFVQSSSFLFLLSVRDDLSLPENIPDSHHPVFRVCSSSSSLEMTHGSLTQEDRLRLSSIAVPKIVV